MPMRSKRLDDKRIYIHTRTGSTSQKGNEKLKQKEGESALLKVKASEFI